DDDRAAGARRAPAGARDPHGARRDHGGAARVVGARPRRATARHVTRRTFARTGRWGHRGGKMRPTDIQEPLVEPGYIPVASLAEIPEGELRAFEVAFGRVAVAHVEQELFGLADECPADGAP